MAAESTLEKNLVRYAKAKGCLTFKFTSPSAKGVPDRVFIHGGACLFLEVKAPNGSLTNLQRHMLKTFRIQGVPATWVSDLPTGKLLLDTFITSPSTLNDKFPI